jgi:hypothetical protein
MSSPGTAIPFWYCNTSTLLDPECYPRSMRGTVLTALLVVAGAAAPVGAQGPTSGGALTRSVKVFDYRNRIFPTSVELRGTALLPATKGITNFVGKVGDLDFTAAFTGLPPASRFGAEYLTYVLWAVTPEGRPVNVAEIRVEGTIARLVAPSGKRKVTTNLKAFGFVVTAEPYFAVTTPSDVVVMENEAKPEAGERIEDTELTYDLLPRGYYAMNVNPREVRPVEADPNATFEILEARHAVQIARWAGAERHAPEILGVAIQLLQGAEAEQGRERHDAKRVRKSAREAVETAEDARVFALRRKRQQDNSAQ